MIIYLVRHGQSYNTHPSPEDPTPVNPPLTPIGRAEAQLVGKRLAALGTDRLITSPMLRTIETAQAIAASTGLPIEVWPRCYEYRAHWGYTCWGARELSLRYPNLIFPPDFAEDDWEYGNEALESGNQRASEFIQWLEAEADRSAAQRMAVVTHGTFTRLILGRITEIEFEIPGIRRIAMDNTALTTLQWLDNGFKVLGINDTMHLIGANGLDPLAGITR